MFLCWLLLRSFLWFEANCVMVCWGFLHIYSAYGLLNFLNFWIALCHLLANSWPWSLQILLCLVQSVLSSGSWIIGRLVLLTVLWLSIVLVFFPFLSLFSTTVWMFSAELSGRSWTLFSDVSSLLLNPFNESLITNFVFFSSRMPVLYFNMYFNSIFKILHFPTSVACLFLLLLSVSIIIILQPLSANTSIVDIYSSACIFFFFPFSLLLIIKYMFLLFACF